MAPIISPSSRSSMPLRFTPQMFYNRDLWLHALALPSALIQQLFMTEAPNTTRTPYYLPPERCPHRCTLVTWPDGTRSHNADDLLLAQREVASLANAIAKYEPVWVYASHESIPIAESHVSTNVSIVSVDVDKLWLRDTGPALPVLVTESDDHEGLAGIDFNFNTCGGKFINPTAIDKILSRRILEHNNVTQISASVVSQGGALEVDGEGTLIAIESSLLSRKRDRDIDKGGIENSFRELLGVKKTIWLEGLKPIDKTDDHIDRLARFGSNSGTIVLSRPHENLPRWHPRFIAYEQARFVLSTSTNANGYAFNVVEIEEAATVPRADEDGWASGTPTTSYVNFYLANGAVIVPQFGEYRTDERAVQTMKELFPDRVVETVMLNWISSVGGGPHCATQHWPLAKGARDEEGC